MFNPQAVAKAVHMVSGLSTDKKSCSERILQNAQANDGYPDDVAALSKLRVDILVTHEAPSCHPHGFAALDELARFMRVVRSFHGHHHDDQSAEYAKVREVIGFDARAVDYCAIKNGLGEVIRMGEVGW